MNPLRVLIVAHGHPELSKGGAEIAAYAQFEALKRVPDCSPSFLAWRDGGDELQPGAPFEPWARRPDEWVFHAGGFDRFQLSQPSLAVRSAFARLIEAHDFDVVHFHHYVNVGLELVAIARARARPPRIVVTLHEFHALCYNHGVMVKRTAHLALCDSAAPMACAQCFPELGVRGFLLRKSFVHAHLSMADLFISPSHFLRDRYVEWGLPASRIFVVENGVEPMKAPRARRLRVGGGRGVFGYFGQIHPYKGLLQLLAAFGSIANSGGDLPRLIIHGAYLEHNDPDFVAAFRIALANCGSRVTFAGAYDRAELRDLMSEVDWVVVPSIWWENAPLVIEEALACRRPVICSDIGGMREKIRQGRDGYRVPVGDAAALASEILRLSAEDGAWLEVRRTLRRPMTIEESVRRCLSLYRDPIRADSRSAERDRGPFRRSEFEVAREGEMRKISSSDPEAT